MKLFQHSIQLNWQFCNLLQQIERFDAAWPYLSKQHSSTLQALESKALAEAMSSCARVGGFDLNSTTAKAIIQQKNPYILKTKAAKEAYGYYETKQWILNNVQQLDMSEIQLKKNHQQLLRYSETGYLKKGNYRSKHTATFQAVNTILKKGFKTTLPSWHTENEMQALYQWWAQESSSPKIISTAYFCFQFMAIKPFYQANKLMMLLLFNQLMLQSGYTWIRYSLIERCFEKKGGILKSLHQHILSEEQADIQAWILLFMEIIIESQQLLKLYLSEQGTASNLNYKQAAVLQYIKLHPNCKSGEIAAQLGIANSSTKKLLRELCTLQLIVRQGKGAGCHYLTL